MSNRIREIRKALRLTQQEFGEKLGVSRDVIGNIEYERVQPRPQFLQLICQIYGVNPRWLEAGEGEMFEEPMQAEGRLEEVLRLFKTLRPEFQRCALEQIKNLVELQKKL